ncbi:N-glycosidase YbiA-like [Brevipalpus obovatus]|uniref:N-glycosidase YbiA-like n=1 Tax=Brevipalpus obovatus TaxID=246614 RepID=UPI003D9DDD0D
MSIFARNSLVFSDSSEEGSFLSNSSAAEIVEYGRTFPTVEHYLAYYKARLAGDTRMADIILMTDTIPLVKKFADSIINHDEEKWQHAHFRILWKGLYLKFTQNKPLRNKLLLTHGKRLIYANDDDPFYGNGTPLDLSAANPMYCQGFNMLGYILMDVRDYIMKE